MNFNLERIGQIRPHRQRLVDLDRLLGMAVLAKQVAQLQVGIHMFGILLYHISQMIHCGMRITADDRIQRIGIKGFCTGFFLREIIINGCAGNHQRGNHDCK